ncbi:MAG: UDP-N-acetylmuramoyl-tripeptide--D-alanyl-D-alanine ligase [Bacteroidota bacterium]|jgi:UDP-N-acetylmuramoyl-tripeptide--D-alanyl-D-alanine ligase
MIEFIFQKFLEVRSVTTDTRKVQANDIFFALKGDNFNGNHFAQQALDLGAVLVVVDQEVNISSDRIVRVENVLEALQAVAKRYRQTFTFPVIGITGSNGKTTTKELMREVLSMKYKTFATHGNLNNHIGVPLSLLSVPADCEMAIIEMGANHQREIASYCEYAMPDYGIITNIGKAHMEGFGGVEGIIKGKGELFDFVSSNGGLCLVNTELAHLDAMAEPIQHKKYGFKSGGFHLQIVTEHPTLSFEFSTPSDSTLHACQTQMAGTYNLYNMATAIAIGEEFGVPTQLMCEAIASYIPENNRSQWWDSGKNRVILDAYNANPSSMEAALINLSKMENTFFIIGDMFELGEYADLEHNKIVALTKELSLTGIFIGKHFQAVGATNFIDASQAMEYLQLNEVIGKIVLLKGSRGMRLEQLKEVI